VGASLTGVFRDPDSALRASERLRDIGCGVIRVFMPSGDGQAVECEVTVARSPWPRVLAFCIALSLLGAWLLIALADGWTYALVGLLTGAIAGLLLGLWLRGETFARTVRPDMRARYLALVRDGRAVLLVDRLAHDDVEPARSVMEDEGAYVIEGYWPIDEHLPQA
jgi:hypothetical protein